jgi:tetratricopeptide (TPR) repeat protein
MGRTELALDAYLEAAERNPDQVGGWLSYGHAAYHLGRATEAHRGYLRVLEFLDIYADRDVTALVMGALALVSIDQQDLVEASAFQHEAIRMNDELGELRLVAAGLLHFGQIHELLGDLDLAGTSYGTSLEISDEIGDPAGAALARIGLGSIEERSGDHDVACEYWRSATAATSTDTADDADTAAIVDEIFDDLINAPERLDAICRSR